MSELAKNIQTIEDLWKKRIELREGGGRMTEYIITDKQLERLGVPDMFTEQEIVRCRDCRYFNAPNECRRYGNFSRVHENGFCAWAERREP